MSADEEGSEYLSDGGDAVAARKRKHARDGIDSLLCIKEMPKASKKTKVRPKP